jgi:thiol-disulfide isomerase/thioredoxin
MKNTIVCMVYCCALLFAKSVSAQVDTPILNFEKKQLDQTPMLLGRCSISAFKHEPYNTWFQKNYAAHQIDSQSINAIKPLLKKKKIDLFLGTWCGDSKWEVPRMLKILEAAGFDTSQLAIVCVSNETDLYKKSPQGEERGKNIQRVPTLIVYEKNKEIGRIIESPVVTLEKDLLSILRKEPYIPNHANLNN